MLEVDREQIEKELKRVERSLAVEEPDEFERAEAILDLERLAQGYHKDLKERLRGK